MSSFSKVWQYLPVILNLIAQIEQALNENDANPKKGVADAFKAVLENVTPFVVAANPRRGAIISDTEEYLIKALDEFVGTTAPPVAPPPPTD